jgi:nucleoid DNA-binding protein
MNRRETISAIGQMTRMRNHDVQIMLEALVRVWSDALVRGEKIELENFLVLEVKRIDRADQQLGTLYRKDGRAVRPPASRIELRARPSRQLRNRIRQFRSSCK